MNNENNNQNNNYVTPESVDLSKVDVGTNDNALNRERDNIISASIQANSAINEESAKVVNNSIKFKKRNPIISIFIGIFFIGIAVLLSYFCYSLITEHLKKDEEAPTTTTTTTAPVNNFLDYIGNYGKLRKFQNNNTILILLPTLVDNNKIYIYLNISDEGIIIQEQGTYNIINGVLGLSSTDNYYRTYKVAEDALVTDGVRLNTYDEEVKYYVAMNEEIESILIINNTLFNEIAYLYDGTSQNFYKYSETDDAVTLENGQVFIKNGDVIINNDITYYYVN